MLSFISQTVQSLINLSFKSQNSHLAALLRKSVTYESIRSPHQVNSLKRMYVFQKLSSFSDYSTVQTSPLCYPLFSHHRHCPTETCCNLPRLLVPPHVTVSSLKPFHLFLLGLTLLCKSEIAAQNAASFPINFLSTRAFRGCNLSMLLLFFYHHVKI